MFDLMTQAAMMATQAIETDEQRVERLEILAEETDVDENTLYDVEQELRGLARHRLDELEDEKQQQLDQLAQQAAPMVGVPGDEVDDLLCILLAMHVVGRPERAATIVAGLHDVFDRNGLYDEASVTAPAPELLQQPVEVDVNPAAVQEPDVEIPDLDVTDSDPSGL